MKKFFTYFFLVLGVIFFLILILLSYIYATDKFGIRSLISAPKSTSNNVDKNPLLSPSQENTLESLGVDPAKLPSTITPEMAVCLEAKLGKARVDEIKAGASPTPMDYSKGQSCF